MPTPTLVPGDNKEDKLNRSQADYDRRFNAIARKEEEGTFNDIVNGEAARDEASQDGADQVRNGESTGSTPAPWIDRTDKQTTLADTSTFSGRVKGFFKRFGPALGVGGGLGIAGIVFSGMFGVITMPISLMNNMTETNDSITPSMQQRFLKVLGFTMDGTSTTLCSSSKLRCRMGTISNSALRQLDRKGIKAYFDDGSTYNGKRTGYPSKNPKGYTFDLGNGKTANVSSDQLVGYLRNNPKMAVKVYGRAGAFNFAVRGWAGKYMTSKFFKVFGVRKDGGIADGKKGNTTGNRTTAALDKLRKRIPGLNQIDGVADKIKTKINGHVGKAKKGGVGYTLAVASCIGIKAPAYIAAGVAAVQLAQLLPVSMTTILSPGSKLTASGADIMNEVTMEEAEEIGTLLTEQTPRESDGKLTSALDSPYLLAAIGAGTGTLAISKFAPGYTTITNPAVASSVEVDRATRDACNAVMSPAAMYTALAVDSAVTVATSFTVIGGVIKIAASFAIQEIAAAVIANVLPDLAVAAIKEIAENDLVPQARGEALGDVIGMSAAGFFSAGGMSRNLPVLKESQLDEYVAMKEDYNALVRDMDIATLSPFDTSSRYTFLGSIAHNFTMASIKNGTYRSGSLFANMASLLQSPLALISGTASADAKAIQNYCSYADKFGLNMNETDTPAINMAGLPCTGLTASQTRISTDEAIGLMEAEGWLDNSKDIEDGATITDLVDSGYIKSETPLADYIETCGDPASGDYLFNAGSCTVNSTVKSTSAITALTGSCAEDDEGEEVCMSDDDGNEVSTGDLGVKNARSLEAIPVFLLDFQIIQSMNGEDSTIKETAFYNPEDELTAIDVVAAYSDAPSVGELLETAPATQSSIETAAKKVLTTLSANKDYIKNVGRNFNGIFKDYTEIAAIPAQNNSFNSTWVWQQSGGRTL